MANIVSIKTLSENSREVVMAFHLQYVDAGDESAVSKVDVSALAKNSNGDSCTAVRLVECWWIIQGCTVEVMAAADTNVIMMHLAADDIGYQDTSECFECSEANGDINNDNILNILDIVSTVNCILSDNCNECSDMNGDEVINILDIVLIVNVILED